MIAATRQAPAIFHRSPRIILNNIVVVSFEISTRAKVWLREWHNLFRRRLTRYFLASMGTA
jgi:hypothetical protein